eukprot:202026-Hanusia_phi.AAC.3
MSTTRGQGAFHRPSLQREKTAYEPPASLPAASRPDPLAAPGDRIRAEDRRSRSVDLETGTPVATVPRTRGRPTLAGHSEPKRTQSQLLRQADRMAACLRYLDNKVELVESGNLGAEHKQHQQRPQQTSGHQGYGLTY